MKNKLIHIATFFCMLLACIFMANVSNATYGSIFSQYVYMENNNEKPKATKSGDEFYFKAGVDTYSRTINYYIKKDELKNALSDDKIDLEALANEVADMQDDYGEDSDEAKKTDDFYALVRYAKDKGINTVIDSLPNVTTSEDGEPSIEYNSEKKVDSNDTDEMKMGYSTQEILEYVRKYDSIDTRNNRRN